MGPIIYQEDITVGTTPTKTQNPVRCNTVLIKALAGNSEDIFYGNDQVTVDNGMTLSAGQSVRESDVYSSEHFYFVSASGGQHVRLLMR